MRREEFILGLKKSLRDMGLESILKLLKNPPGRKPHLKDTENSRWYNELNDKDKEFVKRIIVEVIDSTIFELLCILDHVSFLEDTNEKSNFELYSIKNGKKILINDPNKEELHNLYNSSTA